MPNKLFSDLTGDFLVEGAKDSGYMKSKNQGYGDGKTSSPVSGYNENRNNSSDSWFEGTKGSKGYGEPS